MSNTLLSHLLKGAASLAGDNTPASSFLTNTATRLDAAEAAGADLAPSDLAALDSECAQLLVQAKGYGSLTEAVAAAPAITTGTGGANLPA